MKPYQQRVVEEKKELDVKAKALSDFIGLNDEFETINPEEQERLKEQCEIMWQYSEVLGARIDPLVMPRRWHQHPPDIDGWWLFSEDGMRDDQEILVRGGLVACDDEWEQATGSPPNEDLGENYWDGTDLILMTNGHYTSGRWSFIQEA